MNQDLEELGLDIVYEMRGHTDAARRIIKLLFEIYPERQAEGRGFYMKEWYTLGLNFGIVFNLIATKGNHEELIVSEEESTDVEADTDADSAEITT